MDQDLPQVSKHFEQFVATSCLRKSAFACILGGSDNVVVIWKSNGQGLLRYNHTAPIQRVKYNPTSLQLASCSDVSDLCMKKFLALLLRFLTALINIDIADTRVESRS